ncbi:hypothetical protein AC1031_012070 [Aphanomyces cochlioides]|nr:hypothetical protein AC1031_012070 [Aphanomyces cochlioides]
MGCTMSRETDAMPPQSSLKSRTSLALSSVENLRPCASDRPAATPASPPRNVTEGVVELLLRSRRRGGIFAEVASQDTDPPGVGNHNDTTAEAADVMIDFDEEPLEWFVQAFRSNDLFSCLETSQLEMLAKHMTLIKTTDSVIYSQGDAGDAFFIIKSGQFDVVIDGDRMRILDRGQSFGELGLLHNCIRGESITWSEDDIENEQNATESGGDIKISHELYCLKGRTFRSLLSSSGPSLRVSKDALRKVPLYVMACRDYCGLTVMHRLQPLTEEQLEMVAEAVYRLHFRQGDIIVRKGDVGNVLYMIQSGTVVCTDLGALEDIELHEGDYFGERALIKDEPRAATVLAKSNDVDVMAVERQVFTSVLGPLQDVIKQNLLTRSLQGIPLLKELPDSVRQQLLEKDTRTFSRDDVIVRQGDMGSDFYVLVSGHVDITQVMDDGSILHVNTLGPGDYFGEKASAALGQEKSARRNATVTAASPSVECLVVDPVLFQSIRDSVEPTLQFTVDDRAQISDDKKFAAAITIDSLERTKLLGIGSFGLVYIARHKPTGRFVAVKEMNKARLESTKQMAHVISEKQLLSSLHHPFILKYFVGLQEKSKVYIVTEALLGGELFHRIVNPSGVPTPLHMDSARFYAGCVIKGLKYLHHRNIAYRDLKPENILLDSAGYAKIVDFGFAKKLSVKTFTLCGTPEYLAPEIVLGIGHGYMVDAWALGVLIYEMVVGDSPFADAKDDHMTICRSILRGKIQFKSDADPSWRNLIEHLVVREPSKRMSCISNAIEAHPWFDGFSWHALMNQTMPTPWTPTLRSKDDVQWFTPVDDAELAALDPWNAVVPSKDWRDF